MCLAVSCMHYLLPCCVCHVHVCEYRVSVCVCACERITVSPAAWYRQHAVPSTPHSPAQLSASADRHPSATVASCRFALPQTLTVLDQMHFFMLSLTVCFSHEILNRTDVNKWIHILLWVCCTLSKTMGDRSS